jgi:hypothetical protein
MKKIKLTITFLTLILLPCLSVVAQDGEGGAASDNTLSMSQDQRSKASTAANLVIDRG